MTHGHALGSRQGEPLGALGLGGSLGVSGIEGLTRHQRLQNALEREEIRHLALRKSTEPGPDGASLVVVESLAQGDGVAVVRTNGERHLSLDHLLASRQGELHRLPGLEQG